MCPYFSVYKQCNVSSIWLNITYNSASSANRESFCRHRQYPSIYLLNKIICSTDSGVVLFRVELLMWYLNLNSNRLSVNVVLFWTTHSSIMWGYILGVHYRIHHQKYACLYFCVSVNGRWNWQWSCAKVKNYDSNYSVYIYLSSLDLDFSVGTWICALLNTRNTNTDYALRGHQV